MEKLSSRSSRLCFTSSTPLLCRPNYGSDENVAPVHILSQSDGIHSQSIAYAADPDIPLLSADDENGEADILYNEEEGASRIRMSCKSPLLLNAETAASSSGGSYGRRVKSRRSWSHSRTSHTTTYSGTGEERSCCGSRTCTPGTSMSQTAGRSYTTDCTSGGCCHDDSETYTYMEGTTLGTEAGTPARASETWHRERTTPILLSNGTDYMSSDEEDRKMGLTSDDQQGYVSADDGEESEYESSLEELPNVTNNQSLLTGQVDAHPYLSPTGLQSQTIGAGDSLPSATSQQKRSHSTREEGEGRQQLSADCERQSQQSTVYGNGEAATQQSDVYRCSGSVQGPSLQVSQEKGNSQQSTVYGMQSPKSTIYGGCSQQADEAGDQSLISAPRRRQQEPCTPPQERVDPIRSKELRHQMGGGAQGSQQSCEEGSQQSTIYGGLSQAGESRRVTDDELADDEHWNDLATCFGGHDDQSTVYGAQTSPTGYDASQPQTPRNEMGSDEVIRGSALSMKRLAFSCLSPLFLDPIQNDYPDQQSNEGQTASKVCWSEQRMRLSTEEMLVVDGEFVDIASSIAAIEDILASNQQLRMANGASVGQDESQHAPDTINHTNGEPPAAAGISADAPESVEPTPQSAMMTSAPASPSSTAGAQPAVEMTDGVLDEIKQMEMMLDSVEAAAALNRSLRSDGGSCGEAGTGVSPSSSRSSRRSGRQRSQGSRGTADDSRSCTSSVRSKSKANTVRRFRGRLYSSSDEDEGQGSLVHSAEHASNCQRKRSKVLSPQSSFLASPPASSASVENEGTPPNSGIPAGLATATPRSAYSMRQVLLAEESHSASEEAIRSVTSGGPPQSLQESLSASRRRRRNRSSALVRDTSQALNSTSNTHCTDRVDPLVRLPSYEQKKTDELSVADVGSFKSKASRFNSGADDGKAGAHHSLTAKASETKESSAHQAPSDKGKSVSTAGGNGKKCRRHTKRKTRVSKSRRNLNRRRRQSAAAKTSALDMSDGKLAIPSVQVAFSPGSRPLGGGLLLVPEDTLPLARHMGGKPVGSSLMHSTPCSKKNVELCSSDVDRRHISPAVTPILPGHQSKLFVSKKPRILPESHSSKSSLHNSILERKMLEANASLEAKSGGTDNEDSHRKSCSSSTKCVKTLDGEGGKVKLKTRRPEKVMSAKHEESCSQQINSSHSSAAGNVQDSSKPGSGLAECKVGRVQKKRSRLRRSPSLGGNQRPVGSPHSTCHSFDSMNSERFRSKLQPLPLSSPVAIDYLVNRTQSQGQDRPSEVKISSQEAASSHSESPLLSLVSQKRLPSSHGNSTPDVSSVLSNLPADLSAFSAPTELDSSSDLAAPNVNKGATVTPNGGEPGLASNSKVIVKQKAGAQTSMAEGQAEIFSGSTDEVCVPETQEKDERSRSIEKVCPNSEIGTEGNEENCQFVEPANVDELVVPDSQVAEAPGSPAPLQLGDTDEQTIKSPIKSAPTLPPKQRRTKKRRSKRMRCRAVVNTSREERVSADSNRLKVNNSKPRVSFAATNVHVNITATMTPHTRGRAIVAMFDTPEQAFAANAKRSILKNSFSKADELAHVDLVSAQPPVAEQSDVRGEEVKRGDKEVQNPTKEVWVDNPILGNSPSPFFSHPPQTQPAQVSSTKKKKRSSTKFFGEEGIIDEEFDVKLRSFLLDESLTKKQKKPDQPGADGTGAKQEGKLFFHRSREDRLSRFVSQNVGRKVKGRLQRPAHYSLSIAKSSQSTPQTTRSRYSAPAKLAQPSNVQWPRCLSSQDPYAMSDTSYTLDTSELRDTYFTKVDRLAAQKALVNSTHSSQDSVISSPLEQISQATSLSRRAEVKSRRRPAEKKPDKGSNRAVQAKSAPSCSKVKVEKKKAVCPRKKTTAAATACTRQAERKVKTPKSRQQDSDKKTSEPVALPRSSGKKQLYNVNSGYRLGSDDELSQSSQSQRLSGKQLLSTKIRRRLVPVAQLKSTIAALLGED